ncbi:etoposide-induced protein 2.4 homolog isoform X1 [Portunus trituberculatus]|uniref:etoposide-induced protein 2.4 homolog isoform X1 n=1 Tax=Portunus trituberculatus TaxID=210409 RepID=UPI001E1D1EA7|nr:etoposide-induced protein 2.4 homolog isoform X1 [Portunus trituberculatus]
MDSLKSIVYGFLRGLRDSVAGFGLIFTYDTQEPPRYVSTSSQETSLAQRRAAQQAEKKQKHAEQKELVLWRILAGSNVHDSHRYWENENNVLYRIMQCSILNGLVFGLSLLFFEYVLLPGLSAIMGHFLGSGEESTIWNHVHPVLSTLFNLFWLLPIFILSRIINTIWFQDIADSAYRQRQGQPQLISSLSKMVADIFISIFIQFLFLMQASLLRMLPIAILNTFLSGLHLCLLQALYAFEYRWFNMGWELYKRLSYIEANWPYFVGFGFPLAAITMYPSSIYLSGCLFSLLFPIFIISANEAEPVPNTTGYPMQLFSLVVGVSNQLIHTLVSRHKIPATPCKTRPVRR